MLKKLALVWLVAVAAQAVQAAQTPPYEVVRDHVAIDIAADGSYVADREEVYRVFDENGVKLLRQRRMYYTQDYETLEIREAYTLKPDGRRIDVPPADIVKGYVNSVGREYFDRQSIRLLFANLEAQDRIVLVTRFRQLKPWFPGQFDLRAGFSRTIAAHDVVYTVHAAPNVNLHIDAPGLEVGPAETAADAPGRRWVWRFSNDTPVSQTTDAVSEADFAPHLHMSTFAGYGDVAKAYRDMAANRAAVTKNIGALAEVLTRGVAEKREQARLLYEWVCANVSYVAIELGIGGFVPHSAEDVLENRFGDCKDRAVLLEALLAAKGIESSSVLMNAGAGSYRLPAVASPHAFDHVITYIPAFDLFVDASDSSTPFGVLPFADAGKPALLTSNGKVLHTPPAKASSSGVRVAANVVLREDGSAEGASTLSATGAYGVGLRAWMYSLAKVKDADLLHAILGPNAEGKIDRGNPAALRDPYVVTAEYRLSGVVTLPGPGTLPNVWAFQPFSFGDLVGGALPSERMNDYVCPSFTAEEALSIVLPANVELLSTPKSSALDADQIRLKIDVRTDGTGTFSQNTTLVVDHPAASCSPGYYRGVRDDLKKMVGLLRRQAIYRERDAVAP